MCYNGDDMDLTSDLNDFTDQMIDAEVDFTSTYYENVYERFKKRK